MKEATIDEAGHFFRPKYKVFLSVDIVGSTKLKNKANNPKTTQYEHREWLALWIEFYSKFPAFFFDEWKSLTEPISAERSDYVGEDPEIWKTIGDEIVFVKRVVDRREIRVLVRAWANALLRYQMQSKSQLEIKSCVWGAGFPVTNSELLVKRLPVAVSAEDVSDYKLRNKQLIEEFYARRADPDVSIEQRMLQENRFSMEYLGPDIDAGFRLARSSSPRKLVIGCDIAWLLFDHIPGVQNRKKYELNLPDIRFSGFVDLQGAYSGIQYPVLWIDLDENKTPLENAPPDSETDYAKAVKAISKGRRSFSDPMKNDDITEFLDVFYEHHKDVLNRPFIWEERNRSDRGQSTVRDDFREALCKMIDDYKRESGNLVLEQMEILEQMELELSLAFERDAQQNNHRDAGENKVQPDLTQQGLDGMTDEQIQDVIKQVLKSRGIEN